MKGKHQRLYIKDGWGLRDVTLFFLDTFWRFNVTIMTTDHAVFGSHTWSYLLDTVKNFSANDSKLITPSVIFFYIAKATFINII